MEDVYMFEERFNRFCDKLVTVIKSFTGVLLCIMLLVVIFQVIWRDILSLPSPWTEEITTYLITYITFIGGIAVMIRGEHLTIDVVTERCSPKAKDLFQVLYCLVFIFVCTWLAVYGTEMCLSPLLRKQVSIATGIPRIYVYWVMPISMAICDIYCIFHLFFTLKRIASKEPAKAQSGGCGITQ
jgi:TRAP-type C4-dicarboxylate transport system permease small subunit